MLVCTGIALFIVALLWRTMLASLCIVCAGFFIGSWRVSMVNADAHMLDGYIGNIVELRGVVAVDPSLARGGATAFRLSEVWIGDAQNDNDIWVQLNDDRVIKRSDTVKLRGRLSKGFGSSTAAMYQADLMQVGREDFADVGRDIRDSLAGGIHQSLPEPQASLASGFLLGQKSELPEKLEHDLQLLGLTHIVVASGYNLSILVRFARRGLMRISRFTALIGSGLLVFGFAAMTGSSPSMSRAVFVTGLSLICWFYGRSVHPIVLLLLTAAATLLMHPAYARGDLGWLLSFSSFVGVIVMAPLLQHYFWGSKKPGFVRQLIIESISAQALTMPIIIVSFGQYSPYSLLANIVIVPLISVVMALTAISGVFGLFSASLAVLLGLPARVILVYMTTTISFLAAQPNAQKDIHFNLVVLGVVYVCITGCLAWMWRSSGHVLDTYNVVE